MTIRSVPGLSRTINQGMTLWFLKCELPKLKAEDAGLKDSPRAVKSAGKYSGQGRCRRLAFVGQRRTQNMPIKKWGVAKVKDGDPEQFFIFLEVHRSSGRASDFYSEQELRSDLENRRIRKTEIQLLIDRARSV
jgi:hypothetical protein